MIRQLMIKVGQDKALVGLVSAGLVLRLALAWAPFSYLADRGPLIDDAFYSFSTARNLALGAGLTADGIHPSSGFQPLYTFLLVPIYLLFPQDGILPIHLALSILALCGGATGWFVFRIVRRLSSRRVALFSLFLWSFSPYFLSHGQNGLETGLYGLLLAAALDRHLEGASDTQSLIRLGLLLGFCVLARVDGLILVAAIGLDLLWSSPDWRKGLSRLFAMAGTTALVVVPYFLFLFLRFGSFLPESGTATRLLSLCYGTHFIDRSVPTVYFAPEDPPWSYHLGSLREAVLVLGSEPLVFPFSLPLSLVSTLKLSQNETHLLSIVIAVLIPLNLLAARLASPVSETLRRFMRLGALIAALWIPAYALGAQGQWWFPRYFFPLFLLMTIAAGPVLSGLAEGSSIFRRWGWSRVCAAAVILHLVAFAAQVPEQFIQHQKNLSVSSFFGMARVLDRNLPPGARAGAFQSGTLSYFATRPIINLDGVVNAAASRALREKRMLDYIRQEGLAAVIDAPFIVEALLVNRSDPREVRSMCEIRNVGSRTLVLIRSPDPAAPPKERSH